MTISAAEFRRALSRFASGVTVVTTRDAADNLHGITVSAFASVSLAPPLVLVCIERAAYSHDAFRDANYFVVNILSESQSHLSQRFAAPLADRFGGVEFETNERGIPVLAGALANLECRLFETCDGGDHTIFIGEIERARVSDGQPLVYFRGDYQKLTGN